MILFLFKFVITRFTYSLLSRGMFREYEKKTIEERKKVAIIVFTLFFITIYATVAIYIGFFSNLPAMILEFIG